MSIRILSAIEAICNVVRLPCGSLAHLQALPPSLEAVEATEALARHIEDAYRKLDKLSQKHPCLPVLRSLNRNIFRLLNEQRELGGKEPLPEGDLED